MYLFVTMLPLQLFQVYSSDAPQVVVKTWAGDAQQAILDVREADPRFARMTNEQASLV